MLQNFSLPSVPSSGQFTVNLLQSVGQEEHFIEQHSLHTKPEGGFTLVLPWEDTNLIFVTFTG